MRRRSIWPGKRFSNTNRNMKKQNNKNEPTQLQQGDVLFRRLDAMPEGEVQTIGRKHCVLAEGEATGHAHIIEETDAELIRIGERMLLKLGGSATVVHEEHKPVTLQPGIWEIGRVSEYDYLSEMVRNVAD